MKNRYVRQEILIGENAQKKLEKSTACIIGLGGTGGIATELLARSGINLRIIDRDKVSEDNLHRQILFEGKDIGKLKTETAKKCLQRINSEISIEIFSGELNQKNAGRVIKGDVLIDCTDNMKTRYLINMVCFAKKIPWVHSAAIGYDGIVATFSGKENPCFKCLYPKVPKPCDLETCETIGVLGSVPNLVGCVAATEAIKILLGKAEFGFLQRYDAQKGAMERLKIHKNKNCKVCGE